MIYYLDDDDNNNNNKTVCQPKDLALLANRSISNIFNKNGADILRLTSQTFGNYYSMNLIIIF